MEMRLEFLQNELEKMFSQLELPAEVREKVTTANWQQLLLEAGAENWDERRRVHDDDEPKLRELPLVAPGAQIAAVSIFPDGSVVTLVHVRNNGETDESQKEIGFPGGASQMWKYGENVLMEHPLITAYREFAEEVGAELEYPVFYLCYTCTTNHYNGFPDAYAPSMYYMAYVPYDDIRKLAEAGGSDEGKIMLVPVADLRNYRWFPNAADAFLQIMEMAGNF